MRRLKIPGRIIGREIPSPYPRYFYPITGRGDSIQHRFMDDTYLPIVLPDHEGNPQNPIVIMANVLRTLWKSPWANDPQLKNSADVDIEGRGRDGLLVGQHIPDEYYVRKTMLIYFLTLSVGVLKNGSVFPKGRCWVWGGLTTQCRN